MLLVLAALLSTSATLGIVVEAPSEPETHLAGIVASDASAADRTARFSALDGVGSGLPALPAPEHATGATLGPLGPLAPEPQGVASFFAAPGLGGAPSPFIGPRSDPPTSSQLAKLTGTTLLTGLAQLSRGELSDFVEKHPDAVADLLAAPPSSVELASWWAGTPAAAQASLIAGAPSVVGQLEGLPYAVRDDANRNFLTQAERDIRARIAGGVGRAERDELTTRLHMLDQVAAAVAPRAGEPIRTLVTLDVTGEGRAVVAVGDLATADYVSYLVPGMFFGVDAQIGPWTDTAVALAQEQRDWLYRVTPGADPQVATIAWIGYHTPTLVNVASMELARQGRDALTESLTGLRAARGGSQPYVSILAHSYGSTAALLALQENDVAVDALAMVGSPGSPAKSVDELHVTAGNVWVGAAEWDPIPASGVFGSQPASEEYGAHHFGVNGAVDPSTGVTLRGATSHNDYFVPGGESFRNLALIGIGQGRFVLGNDGVVAGRSLARVIAPRIY